MLEHELIINPKEKDLGDNFFVRRALPDQRKKMVGPFIFWDHMGPVEISGKKEMIVKSHPHIGLATITYLFSGMIMHRDSLGNKQPIIPGEVNWMTAGKGIAHSERASSVDEIMTLEGIQLWLALPKESEQVDPSFFHCKREDLDFRSSDGVDLLLIAGKFQDMTSPVPVYSELFYCNIKIAKGKVFNYQLRENEEAAFYVVKGEVKSKNQTFERYQLVIFKKSDLVNIDAETDCEIMFFGGETFPERRYIFWNFVHSDKDVIEQAKIRWKNGEFDNVIEETEIIPLPEV